MGKEIKYIPNLKDYMENFNEEEFLKFAKEQHGIVAIQSEPTLEQAIKVLQKRLGEDKSEGSYYHSWQSNIAMAFYDVMCEESLKGMTHNEQRTLGIANQAAKNFLDLLIKE